eukprot:CAMPEP_0117496504 /NCGR_PEP_ID=MMETSP0784-20121206/20691_1 /TAXON_ID=39447 /ORGANISM="" /LENGTH=192 /DNA_ID=CAMNT_0005291477 /DNA_START=156 /DNA_END=734 /DNA_ORIENTATION=-
MIARNEEANYNPCSMDMLTTLMIWFYIYRLLSKYTKPGAHVWDNEPNGLTGRCLEEFHALHWVLLGGIAYTVGNVIIGYLTMWKPCGGVLVAILTVTENVLAFGLFYLACKGLVLTAYRYNMEDIKQCEPLHNYAWWVFTGVLIIILIVIAFAIMAYCVFIAARRTRAREEKNADYAKLPDEEGRAASVAPQ